jgi:hypothetical protein
VSVVEIYGLYDPETDELRYVGKAKDSKRRLNTHLRESRTGSRPVNCWVRKLTTAGKLPVLKVLAVVDSHRWEDEERRLIAEHRKVADLLNLADGGAMPSQTLEQRRGAARASNAKQKLNPAMANLNKAKLGMSKLHAKFLKGGDFLHAYKLKFRMRCYAADRPDLYGCWADL